MAKKSLLTVNATYHKVKEGFLTDENSIYRKVKKAYKTIGGVYRPCWSAGLEYYGKITPLSVSVRNIAATNNGTYALFTGGDTGLGSGTNRYSAVVDAYDKSLTRINAPSLTTSRENVGAGRLKNLAFFGGGSRGTDTYLNDVFVVDASLTLTKAASNLSHGCDNLSAAPVDNCIIFGGARLEGGQTYSTAINVYDESLTKISGATEFTGKTSYKAAFPLKYHAVFAGGRGSSASGSFYDAHIDIYDSSLTKLETGVALSTKRGFAAGTPIKGKGIIAGGTNSSGKVASVEGLDENLTLISGVDALSVARSAMPAVTLADECALVLGGEITSTSKSAVVDAYDESLTHTVAQPLSEGRLAHDATTVGDFALVGGGGTVSETYDSSVEAYTYS